MNDDFRVKISFVRNIKTFKMIRKFGEASVFWLLKIWAYASENCSQGVFEGYSDIDIEMVAGLPQEIVGNFVKSLHEIGFMDCDNGVYSLHDWEEHNPWASQEDTRKNTYRLNALGKHNKELYNLLKNNGIAGITADELATLKAAKNPIAEAKKLFKITKAEKPSAIAENCTSNAPCNCTCNAPANNSAIAPPLTNTLTNTNTNIKKENIPPTFVGGTPPPMPEAKYIAFAERFQKEVIMLKGKPKAPKLTDALIRAGAASLDKAVRIDSADWEELQDALIWAVTDDFWSDQVLSLAQIRTKSKNGVFKYVNILSAYQKAKMREEKANNYQIAMN